MHVQGSVWVGLYWFQHLYIPRRYEKTCILSLGRHERLQSREVKFSSLQHTFVLMREITGNYFCVHTLKMGLYEKPEMHSPTGDCCQLLESGLKRSPGICSCHSGMATCSSLTTASHRHLNTGEGFLLLPRTPQSSTYWKKLYLFWINEQVQTLFFHSVLFCWSLAHNSGCNDSSILSQKFSCHILKKLYFIF